MFRLRPLIFTLPARPRPTEPLGLRWSRKLSRPLHLDPKIRNLQKRRRLDLRL
jgi:hypothetical protein